MIPGIVMIRGDVRVKIKDVWTSFEYQPLRTYEISDWDAMVNEIEEWISEDVVRKAVAFANGWTVILDPEIVMPDDVRLCGQIAATLKTDVATVIHSEDSVSGFFVFEPDLRRGYKMSCGKVDTNEGTPLPVEVSMNLERLGDRELLAFLASFGVDFETLRNFGPFQVWELDESMPATNIEVEESRPHVPAASARPTIAKPWWKF